MKALKERILKEGKSYDGGILKVDGFINHQIDPILMQAIAEEFVRRFEDMPVTKIVTIEASGIAPAVMLGYLLRVPVVFVKKSVPSTMRDRLSTTVHSFTKDKDYMVSISTEFLTAKDNVLFIDDFLANGNAALGVYDLIRQSGAKLCGMGFIIEKCFQEGGTRLRQEDIRVESLARIKELGNNKIIFED